MNFIPLEMIGTVAALLSVTTFIYYIISILRGQTKPHLYTWTVWSILVIIAFLAQISENSGSGSWTLAAFSFFCILITLLSFKYGAKTFTPFDKIALGLALVSIIPWLITENALISVIMVSSINLVGFLPTFRKSYHNPFDEPLMSYAVTAIAMCLSLWALAPLTVTSSLYNITIASSNFIFIAFCLWRRHALKQN